MVREGFTGRRRFVGSGMLGSKRLLTMPWCLLGLNGAWAPLAVAAPSADHSSTSTTSTSMSTVTVTATNSFVEGEFILRFPANTLETEIQNTLERRGCWLKNWIPEAGLVLAGTSDGRPLPEVSGAFTTHENALYAHPNYEGRGGEVIPNDPHFSTQWHLDNTGQTGGTTDADIDAVEGWDWTEGSPGIVVAILDTGIESDHPEFSGRLLPGYDFVNNDSDPEADHAHGVYVAGILAASAGNQTGVSGVDHFCKVLPVKVLNADNAGTTFDLIEGIYYAANQGANILNLSLVGYPSTPSLEEALAYARGAGCVLIACAGNDGAGDADVSWPGASPLVISVGWTGDHDTRSSSSATGNALDVVAPGRSLRTLTWNSTTDGSATFSGCSAATPVVSGVASLCLALNPTLSHDQIQALLMLGAEDEVGPASEDAPGWDPFYGHGRVNLDQSLAGVAAITSEVELSGNEPGIQQAIPLQVFPNPSRGGTQIDFQLARPGLATLIVYAADGSSVRMLRDQVLDAGSHSISWDAQNAFGSEVTPGVYFVRLECAEGASGKKILIVR